MFWLANSNFGDFFWVLLSAGFGICLVYGICNACIEIRSHLKETSAAPPLPNPQPTTYADTESSSPSSETLRPKPTYPKPPVSPRTQRPSIPSIPKPRPRTTRPKLLPVTSGPSKTYRLNLDDLLPTEQETQSQSIPKSTPEEHKPTSGRKLGIVGFKEWPKDVYQPARSWIDKLPKPSPKSLPFYECSIRTAYACAWIDQKMDRSESNCLRSWTLYVQMHARSEPDIAKKLEETTLLAEKVGRISSSDCLQFAEIIAKHGSTEACQSVGNVCLAIVTADKRLEQGEITLIAGIWVRLKLETEKLIKVLERVISADKDLKAAAINAEITANMSVSKKYDFFKRRYSTLNGRMQSRRGVELERDQAELRQVIRLVQIYKELAENVR